MYSKSSADAEEILAVNDLFFSEVGIEALRPEAKIIFSLKTRGSLSVKEAMILSGLSYRGFYIVMARLLQLKLIEVAGDQDDRRVRRISLTGNPPAQTATVAAGRQAS